MATRLSSLARKGLSRRVQISSRKGHGIFPPSRCLSSTALLDHLQLLDKQKIEIQYDFMNHRIYTHSFSTAATHVEEEQEEEEQVDSVTARANVKMNVLNHAKREADEAKKLYKSSISATSNDDMREKWIEKEVALADAYSKAIKYIAKLRKKDVARKSQILLDDLIQRHESIQEESNFFIGNGDTIFSDRTVMDLLNAISQEPPKRMEVETLRNDIPVPNTKDFSNVLHSWASSKVKRKGIYAESLLYRMIELAFFYPENFEMPDSKTFGLVVKCYAGSTLKESRTRIMKIHSVHERLAMNNIHGIEKDSPYLLMHSIKSVTNYSNQDEIELVDDWFGRLHHYIIKNQKDFSETEAIDLTGTYTSIIRGYSKLRQPGSAEKSFKALQRMLEVSKSSNSLASVEMKLNAYNMVLGAMGVRNSADMYFKKVDVLESMIKEADDLQTSTPYPSDQSFSSCLRAISFLEDCKEVTEQIEKHLAVYESLVNDGKIEGSPKPYNTAMEVYARVMGKQKESIQDLLVICDGLCNRMVQMQPSIKADTFTKLSLLKVCQLDDGVEQNRLHRLKRSRELFADICNKDELSDKAMFYFMKCVISNESNHTDKKEQIIELFRQACSEGLVSADVLKVLKTNTNMDEYVEIVGNGRLADSWIRNVTSGLALYTDGTMGGEGKNARRKGKSSSVWAKKQAMATKKKFKKERESKGKRRRW